MYFARNKYIYFIFILLLCVSLLYFLLEQGESVTTRSNLTSEVQNEMKSTNSLMDEKKMLFDSVISKQGLEVLDDNPTPSIIIHEERLDIDLDADSQLNYDNNESDEELKEIGTFIDADSMASDESYYPIEAVVDVGEYIDADNTTDINFDSGEINNVGQILDADNESTQQIPSDDSTREINVGEFIPLDD